jgi:AraC-like DNA-binding protein
LGKKRGIFGGPEGDRPLKSCAAATSWNHSLVPTLMRTLALLGVGGLSSRLAMAPNPTDGSISVLVVRALLAGAANRGLNPVTVAERAGLPEAVLAPENLADPDARLPARIAIRLWEVLPALTCVEHFGLWLAQLVGAAPVSTAGWFILSSKTLDEGLERAIRFQRLLHDQSKSELRRSEAELCYVHRIGDAAFRAPYHAIEFGFAQALLLVRRATGKPLFPRRVQFRHAAPQNLQKHREIFGSGLHFDAETDELAFDSATCQAPVVTRDEALNELVLAHARSLLAKLPQESAWSGRVRAVIAEQLPQRVPSIDEVAQALSLTRRTLQRRLADEGTHFEAISDDLRHHLAAHYLRERHLSAQETAFLLGYSDVSAFHRAFARWTGVSPARFKAPIQ